MASNTNPLGDPDYQPTWVVRARVPGHREAPSGTTQGSLSAGARGVRRGASQNLRKSVTSCIMQCSQLRFAQGDKRAMQAKHLIQDEDVGNTFLQTAGVEVNGVSTVLVCSCSQFEGSSPCNELTYCTSTIKSRRAESFNEPTH